MPDKKPYIEDYSLPCQELARQADAIYRALEEDKNPAAALRVVEAAMASCVRLQVVIQNMAREMTVKQLEVKKGAKP